MEKEQKVIEFYVLCNRLKDVVRTGWKDWGVQRERVESVAEHIYGTQMLAIAMCSEFNYDVDLSKVLFMLAIHEMEEIIIGDLTMFQIDRETKIKMGHEAVEKVLQSLTKDFATNVRSLINEFDSRESKEAKFAYFCDKLEADLQCKLYDEQNCVDLAHILENGALKDPYVKEGLKQEKSWSSMWLKFGQKRYNYDENFLKVSNYAQSNHISTNKD